MKKILCMVSIILILLPSVKTEAAEIWDPEDVLLFAAAMELENGCNSDWCLMLTGSVILNRMACDWYPDTVREVLFQKGQYASRTVRNLYTVKISDRVMALALKLMACGPVDSQILFQSQYENLGTVKYVVDGEYFAY